MTFTLAQLSTKELPFFGYNLSGLPLGSEIEKMRDKKTDEDLNGECDQLIEICNSLLTRPMYFDRGWTEDKRLFLRKPALLHLMEYDSELQKLCGWRVRVADAFRPWKVQQQGFCWGVTEVVKNRGEMPMEEFLALLKKAVTGSVDALTMALLEKYIWEANIFFMYVQIKPFDPGLFPANVPELLIIAAANFGLIEVELDPYGVTAHAHGGVADIEWLDANGKLVNTGVPVDNQGFESAFPFMEDRVATLLVDELKAHGLESVETRKKYYQKCVKEKPALAKFLQDCEVDVQKLLNSSAYFDEVWEEIKRNRRVVGNLGEEMGIRFDGWEAWHVDCNDSRNGVRARAKGIISGGGDYAVAMGQDMCAWGNATKLWEKLV